MRTIRISLFLAAFFVVGPLGDATAQQTGSKRTVKRSERLARSSWQPTRPRTAQETNDSPLRRVDHSVAIDGAPSLPSGSVSVLEPPLYASQLDAPVLDGQVLDGQAYAPHVDGSCDALPSGACSDCGDDLCGGGCDSSGCDGACGNTNCTVCGELYSAQAWRPVTFYLPQDGWASFEYLSWWQDGMSLPPLVTTSIGGNVPQAEAGVLGNPATRILYGGNDVLTDQFNGGRLRFGLWLNRHHTWGVGAEYFQIGTETESFSATSTGDPILARPFTNTQNQSLQDSELVAYPGVISGTVGVRAQSRLVGGGVHFRYLRRSEEGCGNFLLCGSPDHYCSRTEALIGYRYLQLDESVAVTEDLVSTATANPGTFDIIDRFETRNQFNGGEVGWMYKQTRGFWSFDMLLRMAVGNTRQTVSIFGETTSNSPQSNPQTQTLPGGLLAQTSNIGTYRQNQFAVVPEFNANIGYQLTDHLRLIFGYTFIYWSNVVRPGDQIDLSVNPELFPPPAVPITGAQRPGFAFDTTDYWVQGINTGIEFRW